MRMKQWKILICIVCVVAMLVIGIPAAAEELTVNPYVGAGLVAQLYESGGLHMFANNTAGTTPVYDRGGTVGYMSPGDYIKIDNVDFGDDTASQAFLKTSSGPGIEVQVSVYLDAPEGEPICVFRFVGEDWAMPVQVNADVTKAVGGVHDMYLVLDKGNFNFSALLFKRGDPVTTPPEENGDEPGNNEVPDQTEAPDKDKDPVEIPGQADEPDDGISPMIIAGIVVFIIVAAVAIGVFIKFKKKKGNGSNEE